MSAPQYTRLDLDLATARTASPIVERGKAVTSVCVLALPAGVSASLAFGDNKPFLPLLTQGQSFNGICPPADEGLYFTNPLSAGIVTLYIGFGDAFSVVGA